MFVAALCEENESEQKNACIAFSAVEKTPLLACVVTRESCVREGRCFDNTNICLCEQTVRATRAHREREREGKGGVSMEMRLRLGYDSKQQRKMY